MFRPKPFILMLQHNTGNNMIIGVPYFAWEGIPTIGDELAAYDENETLIGSAVFNGDNLAFTVWGDDFTTDMKDGLVEGEKINIKIMGFYYQC